MSSEYASKRTQACQEYLSKSSANDFEEFKSMLWDKDLTRRVHEAIDSTAHNKRTTSVLARRYRELCELSKATRSQASSPVPVLRKRKTGYPVKSQLRFSGY